MHNTGFSFTEFLNSDNIEERSMMCFCGHWLCRYSEVGYHVNSQWQSQYNGYGNVKVETPGYTDSSPQYTNLDDWRSNEQQQYKEDRTTTDFYYNYDFQVDTCFV